LKLKLEFINYVIVSKKGCKALQSKKDIYLYSGTYSLVNFIDKPLSLTTKDLDISNSRLKWLKLA